MARRSPVKVGLALALICVISYGQAVDNCKTGCRGAAQTFKYREGTTYKYNFDSKVQVSLSSAEGQQSVTQIKATVLLTQQPQCNQILRLQNVQVISSDGKKHSNIPDVEKPIRINYHDGHLEDSICITSGDSQNSLNLKRAVASIFQANLHGGHETDVFGLCPTEVAQHKEGNVLVIQKSRNLNRCAYRESIKQDFVATAFNPNSEIKSSPILNGDYDAKLRVKNGILDQATIEESYLYVPFSVGNNGAKASVETTLKYIGTAKDNSQIKAGQPRSIIFEDPHPVNSPHTNVNNILAAVKEVAKTIDITVGETTAKEFTNLVRILRVSRKDDLLAVYNQVRAGVGFSDKVNGKKIFLDALLRAGNGDNIEVAIELLKNKELSPIEQNLVYLGLSTVRHATENSLTSAVSLLSQPNLPRSAYLGVGNLAGRYCRQHSCSNVEAVNRLTQTLVQKLGNGKASNKQEENDIIYVLKALGNIHHLNDNILAKITAIAQDKKTSNRLRVTALETYLADPCKDKLRDSALGILKDIQQDSEIRIKAYLALAQCPNNKVGNAVKALLETEPSYQVGGFIVSHIRNLRSSANPDKELAKKHLGLINLPKKFPFDLRKYSANGEFSYTIDSLGIANSLETNIIYSQNSFLPRSTSLNLTAEVFGHNLNFLEIATRQENLDRLIEHYFGPRGLLRAKDLQHLWSNKREQTANFLQKLQERVQQKIRSRRDVTKGEIDHINKQVQIKTNDLNNDLDLDFSVKVFGSELLFVNVNDDVKKYTPDVIIDKIVNDIDNGIKKLKHFDETLRANLLFLDAEFAYPTSSGFPLRLGVEGSSNIQVKTSGAIDINALLKDDGKLKFSLIPSANIEVAGRLTVDTLVVESGLKVISTLHTSTGGDLTAEFDPSSLDVKFALPVEKQNLVSATHDIVFHTREWGTPEVNQPIKFAQNKDFSICLDQLSAFIGLTFCGEFTGPNLQGQKVPILPFPLSGDAKVAVTIEREDLSYYHYNEVEHMSKELVNGAIVLEALGKDGQKKVSLALEVSLIPETFFRASLTSPVTSAALEARVIRTNEEVSLAVSFVQDKNEYLGKIGAEIHESSGRSVYKPIIHYKTPQNSALQVAPYRVEGQIIVENKPPSTTFTLDNIRLVIPDQKTISVNGKFGVEQAGGFADITISDGTNSASFKGKLSVQDAIRFNAELRNSLSPQSNLRIKGEYEKTVDELKHFFQVAHGGDFSDKRNVLTVENSLKYRNRGPQDYLLETKNKLTYPTYDTSFKFDFELKPKAVEYELDIQYTNVKLGSELEWEHDCKREGTDFKIEFGIWGLNNRLDLKSKRHVTGEQSQIENSLDINGKRAEVNGKVKHHLKPQDIDFAADLIVKVPSHGTPFHIVSGLRVNPNEVDASHKVTSGNTVYVDTFLKANKAGNANGSIKVNLKGQLVITGQVKANRGSGSSEIVIELPGAQRTSKIDSTFTIHDPTYNLIVNIYPIFNKDKSHKITLSTHTSATQNTIDSKNSIDVFGQKLEANVKGSQHGELTNGKIAGEIDITLPNQHYLAAKLNREIKTVNKVINGNFLGNLEHRAIKNQPGTKITLKGQVKDTKPDESIIDVSYQLLAECASGRNLNVDLAVKRQVQDNTAHIEVKNKIYGSELSSPLETVVKTSCKEKIVGSFEITSSYTPLGELSVTGKHDFTGAGRPITGDIKVDLSSPSKSLRTLKFGASGSIHKTESVLAKGQLDIYADGHDGVIIELSTNGEVETSDKEARIKGTVKPGKGHPVSIESALKANDEKEGKQLGGNVKLNYGNNQHVQGDVTLIEVTPREYKLNAQLDTTGEKFKNSKIQVHSKRSEDNSHIQSEVIFTLDGKTWTGNTELVLSEITPSVETKVTCPEGKLRHLLVKVTKLSDTELGGQLKIVDERTNFLLEGTVDANVQSVDDFHVKVTANSPALKIDKYVVEAHNKPAKTGRRIQVTAKSGNKNILAGSTSYTAREEHGKLIVEGSGSFKVYDQTKSANFKYIRQNLSQAKNGETGIEISFDAGLGNKAIDAELKLTNKQFRILDSYCEEKKQCAHIEIDVKTNSDDATYFNQEIEVAIDLRKLGLSHEFGLKAVTTRKDYVLDHTVDIHIQSQENSKYQYSFYLHPKEAGVSLTTPKRVISLESNVNYPPNLLKNGGRLSGEIVLYTNKKHQPNQKSGLTAFLDLNQKSSTTTGEVRFSNPVLKRPLVVKFESKYTSTLFNAELIADVFATHDEKFTSTVTVKVADPKDWKQIDYEGIIKIKGSPLYLDAEYKEWVLTSVDQDTYKTGFILSGVGHIDRYYSTVTFESTSKHLQIVADILNTPIFKLDSQLQLVKNHQTVNSEIKLYGQKPLVSHLEVKNYATLKYTLAHKDKPQDKLEVNAGFKPGEIADIRAEVIKNGASHELGHATVKLDDANFLKSDYNVNSKNVEELLLQPIRAGIEVENRELKQLSDKLYKNLEGELDHLGELARHATPSFIPFRQYYSAEYEEIKKEILADKTIIQASELVYNLVTAFAQAFEETFNHLAALIENIARSFQNTFGRIFETIQKDVIPKLKQTGDKVLNLASEAVNSATDIVLTIVAKASEVAEQYRPELQQLATVLGEVSQDVLRAAINVYEALRDVLLDQWQQIYKEIKHLPAVEQLRAEYERLVKEGLPAPEVLAGALNDLLSTLKDIAPTPELKELVEAISDYITKKLNRQHIDDRVAIDRIVKAASASAKQIIGALESESATDLHGVKVPVPGNIWTRIPKLAAVKLSPVSYIFGEDVVLPYDFLLSLVNKPRNWIPPFPLYGVVAQGQHIFTFDGKHLTFPGKCNYLLARDAVDGNFTVIGSYNNGLLTAISLTQGSDTLTLKKHGQVLLNNAPTELPARKANLAAYRDTEKIVLRSIYGVRIICGPELVVCSVTTSGFYHGKLKGLLGNGNNEPYDDFTLPNGKIVTSESEFGNSYKTTSACAAVQTVSHQGHHATPSCDKLFGWESSLSLCYTFVPTDNFKLACEHGVAAGVKDTEHTIAIAYVAACNQHNIPIRVPSEFVKCTNGEKPVAIGEQFSVKTPGKAADIVVLLDTTQENEATYKQYIQPLIQQLTTELTSKGVSDVEFHIIAYGGENQWPSHITTSGGKLTFKGKAPNLKFSAKPKEDFVSTGCPHLDALIETIEEIGADLDLALGLDLQALTYSEGLEYPFRANAIKTIIAVTGNPCKVGRFYPLQLLRTLLYRDKNVNLNLITPLHKTVAKSETKNIVGFNSRNVFALGQTKNKIKHFSDLGKELNYYDYCIDFTVQNDGNVFISDHIHLQPERTRKQFVQLTSHGIVEQLLGTEKGYDCECKFTTPFSATNICNVVSLKEKPQTKKVGTKS